MWFHHVFGRAAIAGIAFWLGGGLAALTYWQGLWDKYRKQHFSRGAHETFYAASDAPRRGSLLVPGWHPSPPQARAADPSQALVSGARVGPRLKFEYPSQHGLVSVVIPTYNRAGILGRAIQSALSQTYPDVQVVVADDGSVDNTAEVAKQFGSRVSYVRQANAGVSAARNFGLRHARGEFIAFLDSDDSWLPWKIEAQVAALRRNPGAGLVWTDMSAVDGEDRIIEPRYLRRMYSAYTAVDVERTLSSNTTLGRLIAGMPDDVAASKVREGNISQAILLGNLLHTSTVLFRRSCCELTGGFDESFARTGEDYEFYIRLSSSSRAIFIDAPSTIYRIGAGDQLTNPSMMLEIARNNLRAIEKWIPRSNAGIRLSRRVVRRRFAESYAWLGEAELDAGHRFRAAKRLSQSIAERPRLDRRAMLLVSCALPSSVRQTLSNGRRALFSHARSEKSAV